MNDLTITTVESVTIPTGEYLAKVAEITPEDGQFGPQLKWKFEILNPTYASKTLLGWTSTSPSLKGKFVKWVSACLGGRTIKAGETIGTARLVGCEVTLVVTRKDKDGAEFNKVEGIIPKTIQQSNTAEGDIFGG